MNINNEQMLTQLFHLHKLIVSNNDNPELNQELRVNSKFRPQIDLPECSESETQQSTVQRNIQAEIQAVADTIRQEMSYHPELSEFQLSDTDLGIIAQFYCRIDKSYAFKLSPEDFYYIESEHYRSLEQRIEYLISLLDREILCLTSYDDNDYHYDNYHLLSTDYFLNPYLTKLLMGQSPFGEAQIFLKDNIHSLSASELLMNYLNPLFLANQHLRENYDMRSFAIFGTQPRKYLSQLFQMIPELPDQHALKLICNKYQLNEVEFSAIILCIYTYLSTKREISSTTLTTLISRTPAEYAELLPQFNGENRLFAKKILIYEEGYSDYTISLCDSIVDLFKHHESKHTAHTKHALPDFLSSSAYLSQLKTDSYLSSVALDRDTQHAIESIICGVKQPMQNNLARWGLKTASLSESKSIHNSCIILLHGSPGTGKTYLAGVIAKELKRPLIYIKANTLRDCYYGNTEKIISSVFCEMHELIKLQKKSPVFLLNEADQLIHRRSSNINQGTDNTENAIQNIFLEELETFPGILVITTNIVSNLDEAISRRIHYKLEVPFPDANIRTRLWKIHLPDSIPGAADIDIKHLATAYAFSGGQISLIVHNACKQAILRGKEAKLTMHDLLFYAELEAKSSFECSSEISRKQPIGF